MISKYPDFTPLEMGHKDEVERVLEGMNSPVSEFNFAEMYIWRKTRQTSVSILGGNVIIKLLRNDEPAFYRPFNSSPVPEAAIIRTLLDADPNAYVYGITQEELKTAPEMSAGFEVKNDPGDSDYIYLREDLAELKGRKYDGKRNHLKKFYNNENIVFENISAANFKEVLEFQYDWCEQRRCEDDMSLVNEGVAAVELIENFSALGAFGLLVRVEGKIRGYSLAVTHGKDTAVVILEKADHTYQGIYQAINNKMNTDVFNSIIFVNREQDMNVEGIRKAKLSYHPVHLLEKYSLRKK